MKIRSQDLIKNSVVLFHHVWKIQSVTVLILGTVMLFSCKTDQKRSIGL